MFVHGALCVCYSGQCLLSSMIGGRSGNRGRCAQPCRLPYAMGGKTVSYTHLDVYKRQVVRDVLEVLHNSFPLRTCRHDFSFGHGVGGRHRPCLRYQMGLCLAPCTGNVFPGQYRQMLDEILAFLNGKHEDVVRKMRAQMLEASKNLDFERAATLRDRIAAMERVLQKQKALAVSGGDQDVVAVSSDGVDAVVEVIYLSLIHI